MADLGFELDSEPTPAAPFMSIVYSLLLVLTPWPYLDLTKGDDDGKGGLVPPVVVIVVVVVVEEDE